MTSINSDELSGGIRLGDVMGMLWRRRFWILAPFAIGSLGALAAGFIMQPIFQSGSMLLIESPLIPNSLVASPFSSYADERIAKIRQQILSRANLLKLIHDNNLYPTERERLPIEAVLAKLRDAIHVELVSAGAGQSRGANTTIAFNLSFSYPTAQIAYRVATQLTGMFINEDKRLRTEQASGAAGFLKLRADELRDRLIEVENNRRAVQARFAGAMPEQAVLSAQTNTALRAELSRIDGEVQSLIQQNNMLATRAQDAPAAGESAARAEVRGAQQTLDRLSAKLSDSHPDLIAARDALAAAKAAAHAEGSIRAGANAIAGEIAVGRQRIAALSQRHNQLVGAIANTDRLVAQSPQAAYELNNLERDHENLKQQYAEIREKQLEAQVAANLQNEDKGEHFVVVDPPELPLRQISPNRLKLLTSGAFGGLALGLALVVILELVAGRIHGAGAIARLTGEQPLATIPAMKPGPLPSFLTPLDRFLLWLARRRAPWKHLPEPRQ
jgi:uncharacterized protein involved in exopolysaccharide biosynthesis